MKLYLVQHLHIVNNNEDLKIIGIYSSKNRAIEAVNRMISLPGFKDYPHIVDPMNDENENGFYIDEYIIDEDNWCEGFVTI